MSCSDSVVIGANVITFLAVFTGLMLFYRYKEKKAKGVIHETILSAQEIGADLSLVVCVKVLGD